MAVGLAGSLQGEVRAQDLQIENSRLGDLHTSCVCLALFKKSSLSVYFKKKKKSTILITLSVQFSVIRYINNVVNVVIITIYLQNFFVISKRNCIHSNNSPFPLLPAPSKLYPTFYEFACDKYLIQVHSYNICPLLSGLFNMAYCFQGLSI